MEEVQKKFVTKKGSEIVFRMLVMEDLGEAHRYINELAREDTFIMVGKNDVISMDDETKWIESCVSSWLKKTGIVMGAFCQGKLVGTSDIRSLSRREREVGQVGISVAKDFRNEGVGKALLEYMLELGKNYLNLRMVILGVFANNPLAISIYEKVGFTRYGTLPKSILYKGEYVDHMYMYKSL